MISWYVVLTQDCLIDVSDLASARLCSMGLQSFASKESLEQLHHFLLVLGVSHVSYSFFAISLAMIKIYSWRTWENYAKSMTLQRLEVSEEAVPNNTRMGHLSTFTFHHTTHP